MTTSEEFRRHGKELVDFVADYMDSLRDRPVAPSVLPGYLSGLIPAEAPEQPEEWSSVLADVERVIMPGTLHWQHPQFHGYYPAGFSFPSLLGDILSGGLAGAGFTWATGPACTELEMSMMNWLAKMLALPEEFLFRSSGGSGGGVIHGTASEASTFAVMAARARAVAKFGGEDDRERFAAKLVAYTSSQAHCSGMRAGMLAGVKVRIVETDDGYSVRGDTLRSAAEEDLANGLIPFMFVATLGTTGLCTYDCLSELGPVCRDLNLWLHVDAAYAGAALACPEYRYLMPGLEHADSFNFNPHKMMLVNFDCAATWFRDAKLFDTAFNLQSEMLRHPHSGAIPDYRHWQIPFGRRFRSLKLWFVLRLYGQEGIREHIRKQVNLAKEFERLLLEDGRFSIFVPVTLGLVCFQWKNETEEQNEALFQRINQRRKIHLTRTVVGKSCVLRFVVCSSATENADVKIAVDEIVDVVKELSRLKV